LDGFVRGEKKPGGGVGGLELAKIPPLAPGAWANTFVWYLGRKPGRKR